MYPEPTTRVVGYRLPPLPGLRVCLKQAFGRNPFG
jgi:hypothetical protein